MGQMLSSEPKGAWDASQGAAGITAGRPLLRAVYDRVSARMEASNRREVGGSGEVRGEHGEAAEEKAISSKGKEGKRCR
jgi:hypothetical protein